MYDRARIKTNLLCNISLISIIFLLCFNDGTSQLSQKVKQVEGTWLIYQGGNIAPDVLQFWENGYGNAYMLTTSDESLLENLTLRPEHLQNAFSFRWQIQTADSSSTVIVIRYDSGDEKTYILQHEENIGGLGVPGISLFNVNHLGSAGFVRVTMKKQQQ